MTAALEHVVEAYNLSAASENKIHDDEVARRFGFEGGLVPGVEVYAYMTTLAVRHFGPDWLGAGGAECRFMKPVYDGRKATVLGVVEGDGGLSLRVTSDGVLCATGHARLDGDPPAAPALADYPTAPLPDHATRPVASPESIVPGAVLGTYELDLKADLLAQYLEDVREDGPLYARDTIAHPGYLLRLANRAVAENVRLGPWIHVGSKIQNHAVARAGDRLAARASVTKEYTHKGHRFVEADVLVVANGETPITQIDHTAIYQPRQVTEG